MSDIKVSGNGALPQINMSKLPVGGGVGGAIFAAGTMSIFLAGIPLVRVMFPIALLVGAAIAMAIHFLHHETPSNSRILSAVKK
jgi:fatty acid desaturase